jgi:hypothetical protein
MLPFKITKKDNSYFVYLDVSTVNLEEDFKVEVDSYGVLLKGKRKNIFETIPADEIVLSENFEERKDFREFLLVSFTGNLQYPEAKKEFIKPTVLKIELPFKPRSKLFTF